jgi:hypothetical protein
MSAMRSLLARGRALRFLGGVLASIVGVAALIVPAAAAPVARTWTTGQAGPTADAQLIAKLPRRWYGVIEYRVTSRGGDPVKTQTVEAFARVTFTLRPGAGQPFNTYEYRPTGTLRARLSGEGDCIETGSGTVPVEPSNGALAIGVSVPGQKPRVEYSFVSGANVGGHDPMLKVVFRCDGQRVTWRKPINWTSYQRPVVRRKTTDKTVQDARSVSYRGVEGFYRWCLARKQSDLETCTADELQAVARVSGPTLRAATQTLDGSRSKGNIESYEWTFDPTPCTSSKPGACADYCKAVGPKPGSKKRGARVTIKPLCTIRATLTVSDGEHQDVDSIPVRVTPRTQGWRTPVGHRPEFTPASANRPDLPRDPPHVECDLARDCEVTAYLGINLPDPRKCPGREEPGSAIFCPLLNGNKTWSGAGYEIATISDPGGPFDGYAYVGSSSLAVHRVGYINPAIAPGGMKEADGNSFYGYNEAHGGDADGLLSAIRQHEGWGAEGKPRTGHTQIMRDDLARPGLDPRYLIERLFAPSAARVQEAADEKIKDLDEIIDDDTNDPLARIGAFSVYFWIPQERKWLRWDGFTVP